MHTSMLWVFGLFEAINHFWANKSWVRNARNLVSWSGMVSICPAYFPLYRQPWVNQVWRHPWGQVERSVKHINNVFCVRFIWCPASQNQKKIRYHAPSVIHPNYTHDPRHRNTTIKRIVFIYRCQAHYYILQKYFLRPLKVKKMSSSKQFGCITIL